MGDFSNLNLTATDLCGISMDALALIVREEDSSQAYYIAHYEHWDWPAGASGPTIGIGCDCGYSTPAELRANWSGIVDEATVAVICSASGLKGEAAHGWVQAHKNSVTITWDQAIREFVRRELPQWVKHVTDSIPAAALLHPDCLGAIVSLAYNRGASFGLPGPRYSEMRAIKVDIQSGLLIDIPNQFLSMRRLWPKGGDLWLRRGHEADLFKQGLAAVATAAAAPIRPVAPTAPAKPIPATVPVAPAAPKPPAALAQPTISIISRLETVFIRFVPRSVLGMQRALNTLGYGPVDEDGQVGDQTRTALRRAQAAAGVQPDGEVNAEAYSTLDTLCAASSVAPIVL